MLSKAEVGDESLAAGKSDVDLGDHVWVRGRVVVSRRGELSIMAAEWRMASKALRPLPTLHKELSEESRVRRRYADLVVREESRQMVRTRAVITRAVRRALDERGFLEIETPILQLVHGGAAARPFNTHLNAFDIDMSLRIALELYLKRTMVGGTDRVYEMGRVFRNEGIDSSHSAEFSMLEAYMSWGNQFTIAEVIKDIIMAVADALDVHQIETPKGTIDLDGQWRWVSVYPGLSEKLGREVTLDTPLEELQSIAAEHEIEIDQSWEAGKVVMELFGELVEPGLINPTSSVITRLSPSRWPVRTATILAWLRPGTSSLAGWSAVLASPSSSTQSSSAKCLPSNPSLLPRVTLRRCSLTRTSSRPWNSAARPWVVWGWVSTGW